MSDTELLFYYLIAINAIAFVVYGIDKYKARKGLWRIPESSLLMLAAVGGSMGAWSGMKYFRHKTKHLKFTLGVPAIMLCQMALFVYIYTK